MNSKLFFGINLAFDLSVNEQLKNLSSLKMWDPGLKKYFYVFNLDKLQEVSSLTKGFIQFEPLDVNKIISYTDQATQEVNIESWRGKSGYEVVEFPKIYQVISYQKPKGGKPQKQVHIVNKDTLLRVWKVFENMKKDKFYDFPYVAERICREFDLKRFFRPTSDTFCKEMFQGTRCPKEYGSYYYFPICVLSSLNLIERKGRFSKRIKDKFEEQSRMKQEVD